MNINIRNYIKDNFKGSNETEIKESIEASIREDDEETLPGLGVFFELVWKNSSEEEKQTIINNLIKDLN